MARDAAVDDLLARLGERVGDRLRTDRYSRVLYSTDASIYRVEPHAVLVPESVDDVHAAVELAAETGVALLPRTSGSSLAGQAVNEALVVDFTRHLDRVVEIDPEARTVTVEPGVVLDELNAELRHHGLMFGPDPASSNRAAMGGIVSNNSTGAHSITYGMTADHVVAMNVILADGSTARFEPLDDAEAVRRKAAGSGLEAAIHRGVAELVGAEGNRRVIREGTPRHWRRCGGYNLDRFVGEGVSVSQPRDDRFNLAKLVCGGEGGLAVITDVTLGLVPVPERTALAIVCFGDLRDALAAVPVILETGPTAVELLDHLGLTLCRGVPEYARLLAGFLEGDPYCLLITELTGESESELAAGVEKLRDHLRRQGVAAEAVVPILDPARQGAVWKVRKVALGLLMSIKGDHKPIPFIEDAAVPVEHLADYVTRLETFCNGLGTEVAYYAHASAGCVHIRPLVDTKSATEVAKLPEITAFSVELLRGYGGSLSSEHGDGRARSWINERFFGPELYGLYRRVKQLFDPQGILNPGAVVEPAPQTENLRFGAGYSASPPATELDFSTDLGFDRAVEMCNGAGVCRQRTNGVMCPSFMVTREEEHTTRGRANALRAAISGALPASELTSPRMYQVMDLCVQCKGCKAECPSSVDMAKLKVEFLAQYHRSHGVPRRDRLFANVASSARRACGPAAPLLNLAAGVGPARWLLERLLGVSARRPLPRLAGRSFDRWLADLEPPAEAPRGRLVLFVDTFANYFHPHVAEAAHRVLTALGYRVEASGHGCCGRPMLSKGLVAEARRAAEATVERLAPAAAEGVPVVGLEPSCLLTLRDEYASLLPADPRVERVAGAAVLFDEHIASLADAGELGIDWVAAERRLLLHGHCHQKALVGTAPTRRCLELPPGHRVEEVDSSCCGMAGSFGYEAEHYDISMRMAERRLLPAVREASPETAIVAPGTSCRHQIADGSGRPALHPAEVLAAALAHSSR